MELLAEPAGESEDAIREYDASNEQSNTSESSSGARRQSTLMNPTVTALNAQWRKPVPVEPGLVKPRVPLELAGGWDSSPAPAQGAWRTEVVASPALESKKYLNAKSRLQEATASFAHSVWKGSPDDKPSKESNFEEDEFIPQITRSGPSSKYEHVTSRLQLPTKAVLANQWSWEQHEQTRANSIHSPGIGPAPLNHRPAHPVSRQPIEEVMAYNRQHFKHVGSRLLESTESADRTKYVKKEDSHADSPKWDSR